jgi:hypothetical protein
VLPSAIPDVFVVGDVVENANDKNPAEVIEAQRQIIETARSMFDVILIDTAPLLTTNDAAEILGLADMVVLTTRGNRTTGEAADLAAELLEDGWNLIMFPEGGRSPDGWGRAFRGGAAYLSLRCGRPVVPLYLEGTGRLWRRGTRLPKVAGKGEGVHVTFGAPMWPEEGEDARRLAARVEQTVSSLADEWTTDWWTARKRAAAGATPALTGPAGGAWRRAWALDADASSRTGRRSWP